MNQLFEEFIDTYMIFHENNIQEYEKIKSDRDKTRLTTFKKKFPYLSKKEKKFCCVYQLFDYSEFLKFSRNEEFKKYLYQRLGKKIRGIFKHGQCAKTEISCTKIIMDIKKGFITIGITKNTLLANKQWTTRCINLMKKNGLNDLKNQLIVISSTFNDLDGNATHCKNLSVAWNKICNNNNRYKVIFVCANKIRVDDVCELLKNYFQPSFNPELRKKIVIQYDEAHNDTSGVPIYRECIENMLMYDGVEEFIPITASKNPIDDPNNPLWNKGNIDKNKLNYVNEDQAKSRIKSDDLIYSSIQDATQIIINETYEYTEYDNIISPQLFKKHYQNKDYTRLGYVNACPTYLCGDEKLALNTAKGILDNPEITFEQQLGDDIKITNDRIYKKDISNFHIMITPCRTIITEMLMIYASEKDYEPVTIGLYGSQVHFMYRSESDGIIKGVVPNDLISKEFNEILYRWLKKKKIT